jgi:23S rRNA (pseudouridine1915-N3)-methyltransferase
MKVTIASITTHSRKTPPESHPETTLTSQYLARITPYAPADAATFASEEALFTHLEKQRGRTNPALVLCDSRGKLLDSEHFAAWIATERDAGRQSLLFAIGPADGWSDSARQRANLLLSFGPLTFPHSLMRVILAEQIYRAFTILAGHPYHSGHTG